MDNKLLTFLEAIQQHASMTKAAQSLFVSQPYISRTIKSAELHFGTNLIDREHRPLELTYAGERLLSYLQSDARLHQMMNTELREISQNKYQSMTIGITPPMADT
ncbi:MULTISPECIES: LysR family transcriptional regulator [Lactiplantibacillus]|nr:MULTISPECIES: LysR family transcriptional regulator [Lactiplantibacillus]